MASPQVENGYTQIANELLEAIFRYPFTAQQSRVVWFVIRNTYGYRLKHKRLSLGYIAQGTGLNRSDVARVKRNLVTLKVLSTCQQQDGEHIGIIKDYTRWQIATSGKVPTGVVAMSPQRVVANRHPKKESNYKERTTKEKDLMPKRAEAPPPPPELLMPDSDFDAFWKAYPRKVSKGDARKAWTKLKPSHELTARILQAVEYRKQSVDWRKDGGQFIPYPASWLRAEGWEDQNGAEVKGVRKLNRLEQELQELKAMTEASHGTGTDSRGYLEHGRKTEDDIPF